ncbi:MAG TPA: hypothetical protein GXX26_11295 [Clostridiaceae bacterium]|nr:hypothetical protein [Clostridiaceae bacterium]
MEPADNPMCGWFPILHHTHRFTFDDESFYPSASFMYIVHSDFYTTYFDIDELINILGFRGREHIAEKLRQIRIKGGLPVISGKTYIMESGLAEAGISVEIGWQFSSHTPVTFTSGN